MGNVWRILWRGLLTGLAYTFGVILFGGILSRLSANFPPPPPNTDTILVTTFLSGSLIGWVLGPVALRLSASRGRRVFIFSALLWLNLASVTLEGAFFVPGVLPLPALSVVLLQQLLSTVLCSVVLDRLFAAPSRVAREAVPVPLPGRKKVVFFLAGVVCYVLCYFFFGAINYELVTRAYYETHRSLATPPWYTILWVELIRGVMIVCSVLTLIRGLDASRRKLMVTTGFLLFIIGGIIPLNMQVGILPFTFLAASAVEIFFQNFITGAVTAYVWDARKMVRMAPEIAASEQQTAGRLVP